MRALLTRLSAARKDQRAPARDIDPITWLGSCAPAARQAPQLGLIP